MNNFTLWATFILLLSMILWMKITDSEIEKLDKRLTIVETKKMMES